MKNFSLVSLKNSTIVFLWREVRFMLRRYLNQGDSAFLESSHPFTVSVGEHRVRAWSWGDGQKVFYVSERGARGENLKPLVNPLLGAGFSVITFENPNASKSAMAGILKSLVDNLGPAHAVMAGGPAMKVVDLAIAKGLKTKRRIDLTPSLPVMEVLNFVTE